MSSVYTCHAPECTVTSEQDENLLDFFFCDLHVQLGDDGWEIPERTLNDVVKEAREHEAN